MIEAALLVIFPTLVAFAGASDLFTMTIPNRVSLLLVAGFCLLAPAAGLGLVDIGFHLAAAGAVFLLCLAFFAFGWMGGGDAKIATAVALWFGFTQQTLLFLAFAGIYGGLLTIALLMFRQVPVLPLPANSRTEWLLRLHDDRSGIPYGITIAIAALQVYPLTMWFKLIG
ncbi:MAG: peptidase [Stappia sp.]|uniref:A24 family peptidase n=1 Tax=Stappia sp. TaxID=1870903 RepID=UPI000C352005|nr:prepilin peptidase [Stappia sp.]MAB00253.1 peptidase [Stappia sp.]MBM21022.1 peptidase [Stappia sp.]|tara:strand:+ start:766 stop:1275 length:510 start_codon:yes stop_codon:yes gene_type:complete